MTALKLRFIPPFPGQVLGTTGINVEEDGNGNWTVALDYTQFPLVSPYTPQAGHYALVFDTTANIYFLVPVTSL
jgi:hypothetical protein